MPTFHGSITTADGSEAIRLEHALFQLHPEFKEKAKVRAHVISHGCALISVVEEPEAYADIEDDPMVAAYIGFLDRDIDRFAWDGGLTPASIEEITRLTARIVVDDNEVIPDDITL